MVVGAITPIRNSIARQMAPATGSAFKPIVELAR